VPLERADHLGSEVHGPLLVGLGRLDAAEVPGALHPEGPPLPVDVAGPEREGLARAEAGLGQELEQRGVPAVVLHLGEERVALLPRQGADLLQAFRRGELVGAAGLPAADLKGRVHVDEHREARDSQRARESGVVVACRFHGGSGDSTGCPTQEPSWKSKGCLGVSDEEPRILDKQVAKSLPSGGSADPKFRAFSCRATAIGNRAHSHERRATSKDRAGPAFTTTVGDGGAIGMWSCAMLV